MKIFYIGWKWEYNSKTKSSYKEYYIRFEKPFYKNDVLSFLKEHNIEGSIIDHREIFVFIWFITFDKDNEMLFKLKFGHLIL